MKQAVYAARQKGELISMQQMLNTIKLSIASSLVGSDQARNDREVLKEYCFIYNRIMIFFPVATVVTVWFLFLWWLVGGAPPYRKMDSRLFTIKLFFY
jgi:hypothetical protein